MINPSLYLCEALLRRSRVRGPVSLNNLRHDPRLLLLFRLTADVLEHLIHLLEGLARRFRNTEERKDEGEETEDGEEGVRARASVLDERRCDKTLR